MVQASPQPQVLEADKQQPQSPGSSSPKGIPTHSLHMEVKGAEESTSVSALDDSGYSSDISPDDELQTEDSITSDSSVSFEHFRVFDEDEIDDGGVSDAILFIREKQQILERASHILDNDSETRYCAARATKLCKAAAPVSGSDFDEPPIWSEARRLLTVIGKKSGQRRAPVQSSSRKRSAPNPTDPLIKTTSVQMITSDTYETGYSSSSSSEKGMIRNLPSTGFGEDQWLMRALLWNNKSESSPPKQSENHRWQVVSDSFALSCRLVPPTSMSLQNAVNLQDVINVTDEARLVTQSTPPFCIVHVNRAFLEYANISSGNDVLVGRPVESIFRVNHESVVALPESGTAPHQGGDGVDATSPRYLHGTIFIGRQRKACRLRVFPVVDRSRRRKTRHHHRASGRAASPCLCMSHILVHVEEDEEGSSDNDPLECGSHSMSNKTDSTGSGASSPALTPSDQVVETVG